MQALAKQKLSFPLKLVNTMTPLTPQLSQGLMNTPTQGDVEVAHLAMGNAGYTFVGYHGTSTASMRSMASWGLDPHFAGSSMGLARGVGFYVAKTRNLALDFVGEGEVPVLMRVYARNFRAMISPLHFEYGGMGATVGTNTAVIAQSTEIVFRIPAYPALSLFRTSEAIEDLLNEPTPTYGTQEEPSKPTWTTPPARKRRNSLPSHFKL